jgi:hypothetical protein
MGSTVCRVANFCLLLCHYKEKTDIMSGVYREVWGKSRIQNSLYAAVEFDQNSHK